MPRTLGHPERFIAGPPVAARPPLRVLLNPLDSAPPTVETILNTPDAEVSALWPGAIATGIPIINLPGAPTRAEDSANAT
jgi:hypothetical protein